MRSTGLCLALCLCFLYLCHPFSLSSLRLKKRTKRKENGKDKQDTKSGTSISLIGCVNRALPLLLSALRVNYLCQISFLIRKKKESKDKTRPIITVTLSPIGVCDRDKIKNGRYAPDVRELLISSLSNANTFLVKDPSLTGLWSSPVVSLPFPCKD